MKKIDDDLMSVLSGEKHIPYMNATTGKQPQVKFVEEDVLSERE